MKDKAPERWSEEDLMNRIERMNAHCEQQELEALRDQFAGQAMAAFITGTVVGHTGE